MKKIIKLTESQLKQMVKDTINEQGTNNMTPPPSPNNTQKINTVNCAPQLVDTSKGKILKFGCKTQGVKELQTLLDFTKPTGYFGSITKQKVMDFQKKNNLKVDGIVGPLTYKALTPNAVPPPAQDVKEYDDVNDDMYDDGEDSYNYLQSLFNTEDDFDGEVLRGDEDGFSNKVRFKQLNKNIKADHLGMGAVHPSYSRKKDIEVPRDKEGKEIKYSPLKSDDLPLDKYLEKKKTSSLDEDDSEDGYDYLNSLFTKD